MLSASKSGIKKPRALIQRPGSLSVLPVFFVLYTALLFLLRHLLLAEHGPLSQHGIQDLLADAEVLRRHLQELVGVDELQALLQAHDPRRHQLQRFVRAGRTGVGQLLGLADVHLHVLGLAALADDHAGVDLGTGPDEQRSSLLRVEEAVSNGLTALIGDEGTGLPVEHVPFVGAVAFKLGVQDAVALGVRHELSAVADEAAGGDVELQTGVAAVDGGHRTCR